MTLHIYSQPAWHDDAYIVGTRDALTRVRAQLDAILEGATDATRRTQRSPCSFCVNDGEGFFCEIRLETEEEMQHYVIPYTAEIARDARSAATWPRHSRRPA
jgi:hypothetical protein